MYFDLFLQRHDRSTQRFPTSTPETVTHQCVLSYSAQKHHKTGSSNENLLGDSTPLARSADSLPESFFENFRSAIAVPPAGLLCTKQCTCAVGSNSSTSEFREKIVLTAHTIAQRLALPGCLVWLSADLLVNNFWLDPLRLTQTDLFSFSSAGDSGLLVAASPFYSVCPWTPPIRLSR